MRSSHANAFITLAYDGSIQDAYRILVNPAHNRIPRVINASHTSMMAQSHKYRLVQIPLDMVIK